MLIFAIFFTLISMNGVVLGNDPAVHLEKAQIFLNTGKIPLANLGWTPPLYEIVLAMFISLTGATDIGQLIFLVKVLAVIIDWLLFLSVYLIASKFFSKKVGVVASVLLLMCFPMYEVNQFGGYTTVLALVFMLLVFLYTPLAMEHFGYLGGNFFCRFWSCFVPSTCCFSCNFHNAANPDFYVNKIERRLPKSCNGVDFGRRNSVLPLLFPSNDWLPWI